MEIYTFPGFTRLKLPRIIHYPWTAPHFPRTIPNDIGWEKILDVLHSHIDRPTPQLHCIDKFEESHACFILTLVFLCPNRTLHQLGAFLNEIFLVIPAEIFSHPRSGHEKHGGHTTLYIFYENSYMFI